MVKLFNTLTRKKEEFKPLNEKEVTFYSCGPTVYDYAHIGNLRTFILNDVLKRVLLFNGYKVKQVMNVTDVGHLTGDTDEGEDKVERSARQEAKDAWDIAAFYTEAFKKDLQDLNIIEPTIWAKATDHISEQIALARVLEEKGYLYKTSDGLYLDTAKVKDYGALAQLDAAGLEEGARVGINKEKRNATDFAVWKFSPAGQKRQMEWDSPWGKGFPGWHLECSAMAMKYLGETIDIHSGGIDLKNVHHPNEIAQSEAATDKPFVRYWLHGDFLLINDGKMAKSDGNTYTLKTLVENKFEPIVFRFFVLSAQYRSKLNFSWEALKNAQNSWQKFSLKFVNLGKITGQANMDFGQKFRELVNNDLAMPEALALAWEVFKSDLPDADKRATLLEFDKVFGLGLEKIKTSKAEIPEVITKLAEEREKARISKKWEKSDELRALIEDQGWNIEDTAFGYRLTKK